MRLDQHLLKVHTDRETVKKIENLPMNSIERRKLIGILRMHGNAKYDADPTINKTGKLFVTRRLARNLRKRNKPSNSEAIQNSEADLETDNESGEDYLIQKMKNYNLDSSEKEKDESNERYVIKLPRIQCTLCPAYVSRRNISNHYKNWHSTYSEKQSNTRSILQKFYQACE